MATRRGNEAWHTHLAEQVLVHAGVDAGDEHAPPPVLDVDAVGLVRPLEAQQPPAAREEVPGVLVEVEAHLVPPRRVGGEGASSVAKGQTWVRL